ncbi:hypothetical protein [Spiroplasma endosymbiont of Megaselia nigra]|uniref:hypothetical protein n=1 Tax=Spiroplasma endosymbiont of Megaselia nigra TaxID=2478537 RepID=UPI000F85CF4C|nr:hypothetical protein [Spiroplasma endosymbiont of Megaselia nigra]RUO85880.1 hypothetical protein D9R21_06245 [Spiroplasma endosymbiont of Megaselia nigra]
MPKIINTISSLKKLDNSNNDEKINDIEENINKLSSFKNAREFKKRNWKNILPPMTCDVELVQKFRDEANSKDWKYTTLMNKILRERYGRENNNNEDD